MSKRSQNVRLSVRGAFMPPVKPLTSLAIAVLALTMALPTGGASAAPPSAREVDDKGNDGDGLGDVFGFASPSDTLGKGEREFAQEIVGRFGRAGGGYTVFDNKTQFGFGIADGFSLTPGFLSTLADIEATAGNPGHDSFSFNGVALEVKWLVLDREKNGIGVALLAEPSATWNDGETGLPTRARGSEFRIAADWAIIQQKLYANVNAVYGLERATTGGIDEESSELGFSGSLTYKMSDSFFLGGEIRYVRAYDGLGLDRAVGEALFLGPTLFWKPNDKIGVTLTWSPQVWGRDKADPSSDLDLANFERHQGKLKVAIPF